MTEKTLRQRRSVEVRIGELEKALRHHTDCIESNREKIAALTASNEAHERHAEMIKEKIEKLKSKPIPNATMKDLAAKLKERGLTVQDVLNFVEHMPQ